MCHIFFIHSSVDGHLGCFHIVAIVNTVRYLLMWPATLLFFLSFWVPCLAFLFLSWLHKKTELLIAQGKRKPQNLESNRLGLLGQPASPGTWKGSFNFSEPWFPDLKMGKIIKPTAQYFFKKYTFYIRIYLDSWKSC